ncbi:MAG TPA: tRNA uridine(34) 5-carboxymethylaminomethyl modification radical SAM/GNAT enzyme Elp3 [Thermoplasmata archaeon]|nr:tRNA uridine(34) 5-carboxymethylaminomethyl modification radical SAM/GNAT enzyme Elp3 [Thermoplasmata archaeon]
MARALIGPTPPTSEEVHREKLAAIRRAGGGPLPSNVDWIAGLPAPQRRRFEGVVRRKPARTLSGVAVVAVMTAPARCPHGRCTYCPGGVENSSPQSYTGEEPSALRGAQLHWDAEAITRNRIAALEAIGHPTSKVEAIVMGGTFPARPRRFQEEVLRGIYEGLNGARSASLPAAIAANETAVHRLVGLTVETRPDWCDGRVLPFLLDAGVTRVEVGVECLHDDVLVAVGRAHGTGDVARATREARDRGLKVGYHLMLGLPGMDPAADLADFRRLWDEEEYRPDFLKIYPTLVLPGTPLFEDWQRGRYAPYDEPTATRLLVAMKRVLPPWVRIQRIQRDIPSRLIAAGVRASNLRERALAGLAEAGEHCRCLRCREVGRRAAPPPDEFRPLRTEYRAAGGREVFLSIEHAASDTVAAFLRLRFPSDVTDGGLCEPVVRELKVVGSPVAVGLAPGRATEYQHRGLGRALLASAEAEARDRGFSGLYVTSAVGTREYYARHGFERAGPLQRKALGTAGAPTPPLRGS